MGLSILPSGVAGARSLVAYGRRLWPVRLWHRRPSILAKGSGEERRGEQRRAEERRGEERRGEESRGEQRRRGRGRGGEGDSFSFCNPSLLILNM